MDIIYWQKRKYMETYEKVCAQSLIHVCSPPGSSAHGILQVRILEWVAISFSRGSSRPRYNTRVSCLAGRFFTVEPPGKPYEKLHRTKLGLKKKHRFLHMGRTLTPRWLLHLHLWTHLCPQKTWEALSSQVENCAVCIFSLLHRLSFSDQCVYVKP